MHVVPHMCLFTIRSIRDANDPSLSRLVSNFYKSPQSLWTPLQLDCQIWWIIWWQSLVWFCNGHPPKEERNFDWYSWHVSCPRDLKAWLMCDYRSASWVYTCYRPTLHISAGRHCVFWQAVAHGRSWPLIFHFFSYIYCKSKHLFFLINHL